jgi:coiled-coil domain-containing protein 12
LSFYCRPVFRNYKKDEEVTDITEDLKITEIADNPDVKKQLDEMKTPLEISEIEIGNLAPRKIDFDLKRSISKRLQKLEKRTQIAICELIRDKLKNSKEEESLAVNVAMGTQINANDTSKDVDSD